MTFNGVVSKLGTGVLGGNPPGVAIGRDGTVYVADTANNQIVRVAPSGTASLLSISGLSLSLPCGLATDSSGNLFIADAGNSRIVEVASSGSFSVLNTGGYTLNVPEGVAVDPSGNIFIADTGNSRVIKVASGGTASLVSPAGFTFTDPVGLATDTYGNLYIADSGNNRIVKVTIGGTGSTVTASPSLSLTRPGGVAVGRNGVIYIADTGASAARVVVVDAAGTSLTLLNGTPSFTEPVSLAVSHDGTLYVTDSGGAGGGGRVLSLQTASAGFGHVQLGSSSSLALPFSVGPSTTLTSVAIYTAGIQNLDFTIASGSTCTASTTNVDCTVNVTFTPVAAGLRNGALVLTYDSGTLTVPLFGIADAPVATLSPGVASVLSRSGTPISISGAFHAALDGVGNIYVTSYTGSTVTKISASGGSPTPVSTGAYTLSSPTGIAVDASGNLFISDYGHNRIIEVTAAGTASVLSINGLPATTVGGVTSILHQPVSLFFDGPGNLYVTDYGSGRIIEVSPSLTGDGTVANGNGYVLATGAYSFGQVNVTGSTLDNNGNLYIADRNASPPVIVKVDPFGSATTTSLGSVSTLSSPYGITTDPSGNLYIMDSGHQRIIQVTASGDASVMSFSGSTLNINVFGITADSNGNLLISDFASNRLVKINVGQSALTFPTTNVGQSSTAKTATLTNLGDQTLTFSADPTYTGNFPADSGTANACTSSTALAAGTSCQVGIVFSPQSAGSLSANITLTNDTLNVAGSTQQIAVSGTAISVEDTTAVAVTPSLTTVNIGQALIITATVSNTTAGHSSTVPTGSVTLIDTVGSTAVSLNGGNPVTLSGGVATLTGVTLSGAGSHTITADYAGVSGSFLASSNTASVTVNKTAVTVAGPQSQPVQVSVGQTGSVPITVTGPYRGLAVPSGSLTYEVLDASSNSVASGSSTLTAGSTNSSASIPIPSSLAAGDYTVSASYSGDSNYAASSTATIVEVSVGLIGPTLSLVSSANPATVLSSVTFTATVSATGSPSGTVTFRDGSAVLGSGTLSSGTATYTTSSLAAGTHTISAVYSGDSHFSAVTSSALSQVIQDFTWRVATGSSTSATIAAGGTASYTLAFTPSGGTTFPAAVTLSTTGQPTGALVTFSPRSLTAGAAATNVTLTIQAPTQVASGTSLKSRVLFALAWPMFGGLLLLPPIRRIRPRAGRHINLLLLAIVVLALPAVSMLTGCGGRSNIGSTPQTYTVTVTATSGSLSHSTGLTLIVQQ